MEILKIISDNGTEISVSGLFYVYNSKYYFIYTTGEVDENQYVKLYIVQVCKEVKNTPTGPVDTGYMLGMEISNSEEWEKVQESVTKIVEDKKNGAQSAEIQYLPIDMLVNLKIVSKNKFKLMKHIVEENFKIVLSEENSVNKTIYTSNDYSNNFENNTIVETLQQTPKTNDNLIDSQGAENIGEVIIDYRARFFEEQEKNLALEEQIKNLNQKLEDIKNIIG